MYLHAGDVFVNACRMESASSVDIIFSISSACCSSPTSRRASKATEGNKKGKTELYQGLTLISHRIF